MSLIRKSHTFLPSTIKRNLSLNCLKGQPFQWKIKCNIKPIYHNNHCQQVRSFSDPAYHFAHSKYNYSNASEMQMKSCEIFKDKHLFGTRNGQQFDWMTYGEFGKQVELFRKVLSQHRIGKNDKVGVISNNRVEWAVAMYAVASLGGQLVPMYESQLEKDWQYIIKDSECKLLLVATEKLYQQTKDYSGKVGSIESVLCFDASEDLMHSYKRWMKLAEKEQSVEPIHTHAEDLLVIIYTSGTTGNPKGVELSHKNVLTNIRQINALLVTDTSKYSLFENQVSLAFLPWAHIYGQTCDLHSLLCHGSAMAIISNRELIVESIPLVKPTVINSVPMLYNRVYDGVMKKMNEGSKLQQQLFHYALKQSRLRNEFIEFQKPVPWFLELQYKIFDKIIFSKIRARLGGRLLGMTSGGAAMSLKVVQFFTDIGILVVEGYGLTETSPVISFSGPNWTDRRLGCVGVPVPGCEVKIIDPGTKKEMPADTDGEIFVHGDNVMMGYHKNQKANDEVFEYLNGKRYFKTGDQGRLVDGRFLKITGRIKEQFKLENGKYVVPTVSEEAINRSRFIAQCLLYGDNKQFPVLLLVPEILDIQTWLRKSHPTIASDVVDNPVNLLNHPAVQTLLCDEIVSSSVMLKGYERPKVWTAVLEPFTQENQMLTPKMSMRRANILKAHGQLIESMYAGTGGVIMAKQQSASSKDFNPSSLY